MRDEGVRSENGGGMSRKVGVVSEQCRMLWMGVTRHYGCCGVL